MEGIVHYIVEKMTNPNLCKEPDILNIKTRDDEVKNLIN